MNTYQTTRYAILAVAAAWSSCVTACSSNLGPGVGPVTSDAVIDDCADGSASRTVEMFPRRGVGVHQLGNVFDSAFQPLQGPAGSSIFLNNVIQESLEPRTEHSTISIDSKEEFELNLKVAFTDFGFSFTAQDAEEKRYVMLMARQIAKSVCVDETQSFREVSANGRYYLKCVHFGWQNEAVVWGTRDKFFLSAKLSLYDIVGFSAKVFTEKNELEFETSSRGLCPDHDKSIFSRDIEDIEANYSQCGSQNTDGAPDPSGAVPLYLEFAEVPGSCVPPSQDFAWTTQVELSFDKLKVDKRGGPNWSMSISCRKDGEPGYVWGGEDDIQNGGTAIIGGATPAVITQDGQEVPLGWESTPRDLQEGDKLVCDVRGSVFDSESKPKALAPGSFEVVIAEDGIEEKPIEVKADDGHTAYTLTGRLNYLK